MPQVAVTPRKEVLRRAGQLIRAARRDANLTQEELVRHLGMRRSSMANIEAGRQTISLPQAAVLAKVLSLDPAALLGAACTGQEAGTAAPEQADGEDHYGD